MKELRMMTDYELVVCFAEGDNVAFNELLCRYGKAVYSYIRVIISDKELTEDLYQETLIKIVTSIRQGTYAEHGKFKSWVTCIAHNLVVDYIRQNKNENIRLMENLNYNLFSQLELSELTIEDQIIHQEIVSDIQSLITHLPYLQRQVVELYYYSRLSFKEIAETTNVSVNTALGRMRYAILHMRRMVEENKIDLDWFPNK